jgi:hypothetical protein
MFASRVRAGFVPATRRVVFAKITGLRIVKCPFANLPEKELLRAFEAPAKLKRSLQPIGLSQPPTTAY